MQAAISIKVPAALVHMEDKEAALEARKGWLKASNGDKASILGQ